jgi:DNA repair protein RadC
MKDFSQYTNLELVQYLLGDDYEKQIYRGTLAPFFFPEGVLRVNQDKVGAANELIERWMDRDLKLPALLASPDLVKEYLRVYFAAVKSEGFTTFFLDAEHQLIDTEETFRGVIEETTVSIGKVVRRVVEQDGTNVIFVHHVPTGKAEPRTVDIWLATHLKKILAILEFNVVDYFVVVGSEPISLTECELI